MAIFDNELVDNVRQDGDLEGPTPVLGSVPGTQINFNIGAGALFAPSSKKGLGLDELSELAQSAAAPSGYGQTFTAFRQSELNANQRYPMYQRGVDLENIYGLQQAWYQQLGNGVAKFGANIVGTFAQSLTNIPNTISAVKSGEISKLSGDPNGYEGTIDNWMRNMDDVFPNYMTRYERENPFLTAIPFTRGSANWWGGKFLPNLGFMVGAVGGAAVQDLAIAAVTSGIGEIPLVALQIGRAALYLNKLFSAETKLDKVLALGTALGKTEQQLLNVRKLAELSAAARVNSGFRYGMAIYGSAMTEAGVESRDAYRQVKEELTRQYVADNGQEPDFVAAQEIENYATNAMNARFGINMALLTTSNTLQFGSLFKSLTAAKGAIPQLEGIGKIGLAEGSLDVFEKKAAKTIAGKVWESVKPGVGNIFREGVFEEGAQFAAERGTYDYYTRKYKSDKYKNNWDNLNEVIKSTTFGMKEQFGSQEGLENMLIGGLTGLLIGKAQSLYENKKGIGKDARTGTALNVLNRFGITNTLQRKYDDTISQAGILQDMQEAASSNDVFKYKNLQSDGFFNFVQSRIPYGMHDVTIEQLNMLKDLSNEQFEQMFQLDFNQTNKSTVNEYVDALINKANEIKKTSDAINETFINPFKNNPKEGDIESQIEADNYNTFEDYKLDLGYYASIAPEMNRRLSSIQQDVNSIVPGAANTTLAQLTSEKGLKELSEMYEEKANQLNNTITDFTSVQDKINIKNQVKALRTKSERISMALGEGKLTDKLFEDLLNFEINNQDATKENVVPLGQVQKLRDYGVDVNRLSERKRIAADAYDKLSTKEGFEKYFEQAEEMASDKEAVAEEEETKPEEKPVEEKKEPVYKNVAGAEEKLEKGREYQIPKAKVASVNKIADDRWSVSYPGGPTTFYKTKEDAKLAADDINSELGNLQKVRVLEFNEDGSVKVENLKGDIFNIQPSRLTGYERLETKEEKFSKAAGDINRQQEELEKKSGDINVGQEAPKESIPTNETKLKAAAEFFASSTGPSEATEDITQVTPQIVRSRVFLNNAKNFKNRNKLRAFLVTPNQLAGLGLTGLVQLQYNVPLDTPLSQIPGVDNVDLGLVAQVFVEEDAGKLYFVDEKGERIGEVNGQPTDLSRIVFKAMPTTELYYNYTDKQGNRVPKYRQGEKETFQAYANGWKQIRSQLFQASAFPIKLYKFNVSRGVAKTSKIDGKFVTNHVGNTILPEDKIAVQEGLIVINKEGFIAHQGKNIGWPIGSPAIQYADTLEYINNTKLSKNKATSVYQVFKALAADTMKQYEAGKGISLNEAYMTYLQNVLYFRKTGGVKDKSNQFFIDTANMSISLGGKTYKLDEIDTLEKEMVEQLRSTFHNLNSFTLKNSFYSPFYEYVYEDGNLKEVEWSNYQSYLLSAKTPDGKSRSTEETPYLTNVTPPTPAVPYSFEQKYATLIDFDFPPVEMPKAVVSPTGAPMIGEYDMGGENVNTYPSQLGPIDFTGTITKEDGKDVINVDVKDNDTVVKLTKDSEFVEQTVIPTLKQVKAFDPADDDITLVKKWASFRVMGQLYAMKEAAAPKEEVPTTAAVFTPTTPYGTPTGAPITTSIGTTPISDIERIEIPRYFTFGELGGKPGKKPGETIESEKNAEIQQNLEQQLQEGDKLIEPNGNVFYYKNGKVIKPNGQARGFKDIGAFLNGVTIERSKVVSSDAAKADIEKTLYGTISGSIPLSQALPNGVYTDLGNGLFAYADKNEKIAAVVDRANGYIVSKSFWNEKQNKWQLPNEANLRDDAKKLGVDETTYIKKYQDAVNALNAKADIEQRRQEALSYITQFVEVNPEVKDDPSLLGKWVALGNDNSSEEDNYNYTIIESSKEEVIKKMNSLYDAELAALEGAKPAEPTVDFTSTLIKNLENELFDKSNRLQQMEINAELAGESVNRYWYIADNLPKIKPESARRETGVKTGSGKDISSSFLNAKTGVSVERAAEMIVEQAENENTGLQLTEDFVRNEIIDLLQLGKKEYKKKSGSVYKKDIEALRKEIDELSKQLKSLQKSKPGGFDVNEAIPPSDEYMRVGKGEAGQQGMSDAELQAFKAWHAKKAPGIPFEVLDNIVNTHDNEKAWGVFENGVAKFYKGAPGTTPYHEIGEGIWKAFLTPEQRQLILDEFKAKSGQFTDRASEKKIYYADATDQQAKERIWDDFAEFRAGKVKAKSLGERVLAFFRNIIEFFKSFVQKPSMKEELFKAIEAGKFKEFRVPERVKRDVPEYMRIPGLTETQAYDFVQDMVIRSGRILFGGSKKFIFKMNPITGREVFNTIEQEYIGENKRQQLSDVAWNMLKKRTIDSLRTIGINYNEEDLVNINSEGTTGLGYSPEPFSVNWKKSSPFPIKFLAFIMPKTKPTNQQNATSLELPKKEVTTTVLGSKMAGYGRIFSTLFNKLANTTNPKLMGKKLSDLARYDADFVRFFEYVGGNRDTGDVDFTNFKNDDWRLYIQFFQTFSLQKPEAFAQYVTGSQVYTAPANQFTAAKEIEYGWFEAIKALSKDPNSIITYNKQKKTYEVNTNEKVYPTKVPKEAQDQIDFLAKIGIRFGPDAYANLKDEAREDFSEAVGSIHAYLKKTGEIGTVSGKELGINSYISTLANLLIEATNPITDSTYPGVDGSRLQSYSQNNYFSVFENEFNEAETLEDLINLRPELQDIFSQNSISLMRNGLFYKTDGTKMKLLKVSYIQGEKNNDTSVGKTTSSLSLGARMTQEINQNLNGQYYVMLPADSSTEWMMNLGNYITFEDIKTGRALNRLYKVFKGYLIDDINIALDWKNRSKINNVGNKAKELRFFKEILSTYNKEGNLVPSDVLTEINRRIEAGEPITSIEEYINDKDVAAQINEMVKTSVEEIVARTRAALVAESQLVTLPMVNQEADVMYSYPKLDNKFTANRSVSLDKFKLSNEDVNNILTFARMNYMIANVEFHKILFGDPYQFKIKNNILDETKRVKSFGSPRRVTFDTPEYNAELNDAYNKVGDITLDSEELGYHLHKDYANTITVKDIEFASKLYPEVNEADADSWLMDTAYRELKLKNAQWPDEAEDFHQWQMAYTRQNMPGYEYKNEALRKRDEELVKKPEPVFVIEKLKPVATGTKAATTSINLVLDKFAQLPIYYKAVQGRNLEKLYIKMWKEKVDYAVMVSGRKLGAETLQNFYANNEFNEAPFNNFVKVPWKALGIQVENSYENPKDQTWGSQPAKIASMDFFGNGEEAMPGAKKVYDAYIDATKRYHENKYQQLLKKLGLENLGDGFRLADPKAIAETLEGEFFRRQLSENVKYAIQLDENNQFPIPFEASTHYKQIKDILYSMVNKALVSPKLNGGPKAMSSVTLWEKGKRDPNAPNPELKFYTKDDPYIEILLPYKYKSKFNKRRFPTDESILEYLNNTPEGKQIIQGVGFRVPCDAQNKIDTYRIKGFLPEFMGDVVIVPSELTAKAGLDFDFDKMSTYLKSIYVDKNGNVRLVKYQGSEEATKEFFAKVFDDRLEKKKVSKSEILDALQILDLGLEDPNNLVERYADLLDLLLEDATAEDRADTLIKELEKLGDANFQAAMKERYVEDMYNRSLENDYFQTLENMLTLPGNFERRLIPTNDAGLKEVANEINTLRGVNADNIKNRLLDGVYMTTLRNDFITGKAWIGIVATNITSHSLAQKTQVTLDPTRIEQLSDFEKMIIGSAKVALPHNTVSINGLERLSLSGTKTADGSNQYISDRLAGYGTAVLDVAKDRFIMDIIYSDLLISPTMFLERMGAGKYVSKFINQPIIRKYISHIESKGERGLFSMKNVEEVKQLFPTTSKLVSTVGIDVNNLDNNIEQYAKDNLTSEQNAEQHNILDEFLRYAKMAQYSFKLTQAVNYDTSKSRNSDSFSRKQTKTGIAQQKNIFCCAENILEASFIGNQRDLLDFAMSSMGEIIKTEKDEFRIITDSVLTPYEEVEYMKDEDFERVGSKLKASFIDFIIQTKTNLNNELAVLTLGNDSVAKQLEEAKKKYPQMRLLNDLQVVTSDREGGAESIRLRVKITDPVDENIYTEMMRELNDIDPQLFKSIVKIALIQGTYDSSISIKNIIPPESYSETVKPIIDSLVPTPDVQLFSKGAFQKNNWNDDVIVPVANVSFFIDENVAPFEDQFGNEYYKYKSPGFVAIKELGITDDLDRRILLLSPKYNSSDIQYEFLKIRKITPVGKAGELVDVETGMSVTNAAIYNRKKSGDLSVDDVYGYQKVRDGLGNPVTTADGRHVYKLTNLWGDGNRAIEYYLDSRRSVYNNGTVQIDNEIPDADIIRFFGGVVKAEEEVVPSQPVEQAPVTGISTPSGKLKLRDGKEYNIADINASLLESIGYKPKEIGKLLKSIC